MSQTKIHTTPSPCLTIFLAEDDFDDQEFLKEALHSVNKDIELITFSNGLKFIDHLSQTKDDSLPGLIILDYNIPEINGAKVLEQLQLIERYNDIPKIVWSTSDSEMYRQSCLQYGASAYLVKPSSISGINELAKQMLTYCEPV